MAQKVPKVPTQKVPTQKVPKVPAQKVPKVSKLIGDRARKTSRRVELTRAAHLRRRA